MFKRKKHKNNLYFDEKKGEMYLENFKIKSKKKFKIDMFWGMIGLTILTLVGNYIFKH